MGGLGRAVAVASAFALAACGTSQRVDDGGSRVEYLPLRPGKRPGGKPPKVPLGESHARAGELGDGSVASELVAGARRLLEIEVAGGSERFAAHLRAVALWEGALVVAERARVGEVADVEGRLAVCEAVGRDGRRTFIGPGRDDVVRRFVGPAPDVD